MNSIHKKANVLVVKRDFPDKKDLFLLPLGDLHWDSRFSDHKLIEKKIEEIAENDYYTVLIGDTFDKSFFDWLLKEQQNIDLNIALESIAKKLEPIRKKIFLVLIGNHEKSMEKRTGFNMGEALARILEIPYSYGLAVLHLRVGRIHKSERMNSYIGLIAHGYGSARTKGGKVNKAVQLADLMEQIDFSIMGHVHDPASVPTCRLIYNPHRSVVYSHAIRNVILSTFQEYPTYAQEAFLSPSPALEYLIRFDGEEKRIEVREKPI